MIVVFVHGWSVTDTDTYGGLPEALQVRAPAFGLEIDIRHIWLGRYISFDDDVRMSDVTKAFDAALREQIPDNQNRSQPFSCITHSTGGPVIREWVDRYFGAEGLADLPLQHLVMLAPANHGSPLAVIGKERVGRLKAWFQDIEPGQQILDWLSLGSEDQWRLSERYLDYAPAENGFFPFVLTGQTINRKLYDFLNSYLAEVGSDGVVRVAGANLNYTMLSLREGPEEVESVPHGADEPFTVQLLEPVGGIRRPPAGPLGVIPRASHSGDNIGIMKSVTPGRAAQKPVVDEILRCLGVGDGARYQQRLEELAELTQVTQARDQHSKRHRYNMLVFRIRDNEGNPIDDFDMFLLAGAEYRPDQLPKGFFVDRQRNPRDPNRLVYYIDHDVLTRIRDQRLGIRVIARPRESSDPRDRHFTYYRPVEFRTDGETLEGVLRPNETIYVDIEITRRVDKQVFRLDRGDTPRQPFDDKPPLGQEA